MSPKMGTDHGRVIEIHQRKSFVRGTDHMRDLRKTTEELRLSFKAAVRRALTLGGGGESVQHATRVKAPALSRYASPGVDRLDDHCPIDIAVDLDLEAGEPIILSALAKAQGYELLPLAPANASGIAWETKLCRLGQVRGEFYGVMGEALADGHLDAAEAGRIDAKIEEEIAQLRKIQARIRKEGEAGGAVVRMTGGARS